MFLNRLNEEEKKAFLSLCMEIIAVDDDVVEEEMALVDEYCKEMNIDADMLKTSSFTTPLKAATIGSATVGGVVAAAVGATALGATSLLLPVAGLGLSKYFKDKSAAKENEATAVDILKASSTSSKKIVITELLGLVYADGEFKTEEKDYIAKLIELFEISDDDYDDMKYLIKKYCDIVENLELLISE